MHFGGMQSSNLKKDLGCLILGEAKAKSLEVFAPSSHSMRVINDMPTLRREDTLVSAV